MSDTAEQPTRADVRARRLRTAAKVFAVWGIVGLVVGWESRDWTAIGFITCTTALICWFVPPHRPVLLPSVVLSLFAIGAAASFGGGRKEEGEPAAPGLTSIQRAAVERTVRDWFSAARAGDDAALCVLETQRFSKTAGHCRKGEKVVPDRSVPGGGQVRFDALLPRSGGFEARVHAGERKLVVELRGTALLRVDAVRG